MAGDMHGHVWPHKTNPAPTSTATIIAHHGQALEEPRFFQKKSFNFFQSTSTSPRDALQHRSPGPCQGERGEALLFMS